MNRRRDADARTRSHAMPRLAVLATVVVAAVVALVLGTACAREDRGPVSAAGTPAPSSDASAAATPRADVEPAARETPLAPHSGESPDLSRFNPQVQRQLRDRIAWHRRVLETPGLPDDRRAAAHGELANLYHAYELFAAAEPLYLEAQRLAPHELRWPYYLGHLYRSRNQLEQSVASFTRALELDPRLVPALVRLGEVEIDLDRADPAGERLRAAVAIDPRCAAAYFHLGLIAQARGDAGQAVDLLRRALELQPAASSIHRSLGLALRELGSKDEARRELDAAGDVTVALADPLMTALHRLSVTYWEKLAEGERLLADGKLEPARRALEDATGNDPLAAPPRILLGEMFAGRGSTNDALRQLELAVFLSDDGSDAQRRLARLWLARNDLGRAIEAYRAVLAVAPDDGPTLFELAEALGRAGRTEEALTAAHRSAVLVPDHPMPLLLEATLLIEGGRCADAAARLEQGLARSPRQGVWAHGLARVLAACPDQTVRDGKRALEIARSLYAALPSPGHAATVAKALAETGDLEGALRWQQQAIELARKAGREDFVASLDRDRARFAAGEPSREPWRSDELDLLAAGPRSFR